MVKEQLSFGEIGTDKSKAVTPNKSYIGSGTITDGRTELKIKVHDWINGDIYDLPHIGIGEFGCGPGHSKSSDTALSIMVDLIGPIEAADYFQAFRISFLNCRELKVGRCLTINSSDILSWMKALGN